MIDLEHHPDLAVFSVKAMNTSFTFRLDTADVKLAQEAVSACMNQLEEIENDLSRFRMDSDITRINSMKDGQSLFITEQTHRCLLLASEASAVSAGLFDVTIGAKTWSDESLRCHREEGALELSPDRPLVNCIKAGRQVDLGGIGKGFALDQMAKTISAYQIESALISAGASSQLAIGTASWPLRLTGEQESLDLPLQGRALSATGSGIQGAHVVRPDVDGETAYAYPRVWLLTESAGMADALSTACLLMDPEELRSFAEVYRDDLEVYFEDANGVPQPVRVP